MDPIRSIVVPTDFCSRSKAAEMRGAQLALFDDAAVHLVHVLRFPLIATAYEVSVPGAIWEGVQSAAKVEMESARKAIETQGVTTVTGEIKELHDPAEAIAQTVKARAPDLVVMATHGRGGFSRMILGSVTERILRNVHYPVLAVKEDLEHAQTPIKRILLAVDFSVHSDRALEVTCGLARRFGASVDILHAFDFPTDYIPPVDAHLERKIEDKAAAMLDRLSEPFDGTPVSLHLRRGRASAVILEAAEVLGTSLIIMGRRGLGGLSHVLLGSVAERTIRAAPCSVLTVQAEGT